MNPSPRLKARLAAWLNIASAVPAGFSVSVLTKLFVRGDPAATAANILGSEAMFRLGTVAEILGLALFVAAVLWMVELFKAVSRPVALLVGFFGLLGSTIQALDVIADSTALLLLKGGAPLAALTTAQLQDLAWLCLRLHSLLYTLALAFFGFYALLLASLILRSTFLPRAIGAPVVIEGLGYLLFSASVFLSPPFAARLYPVIPFATAAAGELLFMLWLIVKAVNTERWEAQALATRSAR